MIIREIKATPALLDNFDWVNDYKDTRQWAVHCAPELIEALDAGYNKWLKAHHARTLSQIEK